jgi:hypothetical protein
VKCSGAIAEVGIDQVALSRGRPTRATTAATVAPNPRF